MGETAAAGVTSSLEGRPCPRCGAGLFGAAIGAGELFGCGACGGVWIDDRAWRAVTEGAGQEIVARSEQASRHVGATPPSLAAPACPACGEPLVGDRVPETRVDRGVCAAHGSWFDRGALRIAALHYANLPAPLRFDPADYGDPVPQTLGDLLAGRAPQVTNSAIPFVPGSASVGLASDAVIDSLLAVAVLGFVCTLALHVASLLFYTVTAGALLLASGIVALVVFCLGITINKQLGNATQAGSEVSMDAAQISRGLKATEKLAFWLVLAYGFLAVFVLWPYPKESISLSGGALSVPEARACWPFDMVFYWSAVAMLLSGKRIAKR